MARPKITPLDQARPFNIDELFFSITDLKGVICSGNDVFARVSGYGAVDELISKPHNIIRHPDMPRAVFKLLWDYLNSGKAFAGYVKNIATDGCYYWVMALIVPIREGYLSIRFKPTSNYFSIVKDLYAELLAIEKRADDAPDSWRAGMLLAGERLSESLKEKGFVNYDEFMRTALAAEMISRRAKIGTETVKGVAGRRSPGAAQESGKTAHGDLADALSKYGLIERQLDDLFSEATSFLELVQKLDKKSSFLLDLADNVRLISLNGVIASNRLGEAGGGLSVVTQHLATIAEESTVVITEMTDQLSLTSPLRETAFAITAAKLQVEMTIFFMNELIGTEGGREVLDAELLTRTRRDIGTLVDSFSHGTARMLETLPKAQDSVLLRIRLNDKLTRVLQKLSRVHVTGKVQAAHIAGAGHFQEYFEKIYEQLQVAKSELREISEGVPFLEDHLPRFEHAGRSVHGMLNSFQ